MAAALLQRFHKATTTMPFIKESSFEVACHNDFSPTNTVFIADEPIAMIDFDTAQPGSGSGTRDIPPSRGSTSSDCCPPATHKITVRRAIQRLMIAELGHQHMGV
ncbi:hypothetical protein DXK93_01205 [Achromobacter sp. K91]|nr:hypothetical protein DXK93_01205 [Achromobacter sp. K91]